MESSQGWLEELGALRAANRPCVIVVVTHVEGSAPREPGARMLVTETGLAWGTIGGGNLERLAIDHGLDLLRRTDALSGSVDYPLAEKTGQCCGGRVTVFFEPLRWKRHTIAIFGAGHVGQALGALAPWMKADVRLIDGREEAEIRPRLPSERPYELLCVDAPEAEIDELPPGALVLVMTHSHALDLEIVERALGREGFPYLGLIGSGRKWRRFRDQLLRKGLAEERVDSVRCPIGLSQAAKDPDAIALSTAAELVEVLAALDAAAQSRDPQSKGAPA